MQVCSKPCFALAPADVPVCHHDHHAIPCWLLLRGWDSVFPAFPGFCISVFPAWVSVCLAGPECCQGSRGQGFCSLGPCSLWSRVPASLSLAGSWLTLPLRRHWKFKLSCWVCLGVFCCCSASRSTWWGRDCVTLSLSSLGYPGAVKLCIQSR